jgi:hypothetical protein
MARRARHCKKKLKSAGLQRRVAPTPLQYALTPFDVWNDPRPLFDSTFGGIVHAQNIGGGLDDGVVPLQLFPRDFARRPNAACPRRVGGLQSTGCQRLHSSSLIYCFYVGLPSCIDGSLRHTASAYSRALFGRYLTAHSRGWISEEKRVGAGMRLDATGRHDTGFISDMTQRASWQGTQDIE